jgi:Ca-activated chloride channel family protein
MRNRILLYLAIISTFIFFESAVQSVPTRNAAFSNPFVQQQTRAPTIRSSTNLVLVPISVRDASGRPVTNLRIEDFKVLENGQAATLQHLGKPELTKLEIVLVFDITSSTWYYFDIVKESAIGFVKSIFRPGDAVSIIGISSPPEILLERTESLSRVLDGLNQLRRGAATAFFDAVVAATRLFPAQTDPETRHVIVVLSDGEDNFSIWRLEDALERIHRTDAVFYSINPGASPDRLNRVSRRGQQWMETLANQTGGEAFLAESFEDLDSIYARIAEELQVQYLLSYYSPDSETDDGFRSIAVTLPEHPELKVRARSGYYPDNVSR